ncbi:MAG: hypothetical protein H6767_02775 [Candidatus Peribacteria bacterium]|nr:MAG: hypothetical protein H6767_02775 [Candidatus Peribacteria bacterium]
MGNVQDFQMYISAEKYAGLIADAEIQPLLVDLGEKMMIYSMVARDYADGINEDWSGNEFFGDAQTGNGIIRLHFIYLLTL